MRPDADGSIHLTDHLHEALVDAPSASHVQVQYIDVGGEQRIAIFQHPASRIHFDTGLGAVRARFRLGCGIKTVAWESMAGPVTFRIGLAATTEDEVTWLFEETLDPSSRAGDREWRDVEIDIRLERFLVLETIVRQGRSDYAWSGWSDPVIFDLDPSPAPPSAPLRSSRRRSHTVLITSDACRLDTLGIYGGPVATPNLDRLKKSSLTLMGARTNSTTTIGSYASLLSGRFPWNHGVISEWGTFPPETPNLPSLMRDAGYHTIFAPSELEIALPQQGISRLFDEVVPCVGNPSQDGDVTTRILQRAWGERPENNLFLWVSYFDTHPPQRLPQELIARFYDADPRSEERTFRPEAIDQVRGVESVVELRRALRLVERGIADGHLVTRLRATAASFRGEIESAPDLATHLVALGPEATLRMSPFEFAEWLDEEVEMMESHGPSPRLLEWFHETLKRLEEIEREIRAPLQGVLDFRYFLALAEAAVAHLDKQVGSLLRMLDEEGSFNDSVIVFCSPHGELYGEGGNVAHHHDVLEPVLRIPMMIKPPRSAGIHEARSIEGTFEIVDLLPTIASMLGLSKPAVDGRDLWDNLLRGRLESRPSTAMDSSGIRVATALGDMKLVRSEGWTTIAKEDLPPGSTRLFRVTEGEEILVTDSLVEAELLEAMESSLRTST